MLKFSSLLAREGSKAQSIRVVVPHKERDKLLAGGASLPGWVRVSIDGSEPFFTWARRPPSRNSVEIGVPIRLGIPRSRAGESVPVEVEDAEPYRANPWTPSVGVDWLPFVPTDLVFPQETIDGRLVLHSSYEEPFCMRRVTSVNETYRLLGWYQAEGSKSETGRDVSFATNNPLAFKHYADLFQVLGLGKDKLSMEVLRAPLQDPAEARAAFEHGIRITAERVRSGAGNQAGVLHVCGSQALNKMFKGILDKIHNDSVFPSQESALQYALGWLDGDGTITLLRNSGGLELRLAGFRYEQEVTLKALSQGFNWTLPDTCFGTPREHTGRTLTLDQAAELAIHGGFKFSMSRARLIWSLDTRLTARENRVFPKKGRSLTTAQGFEKAKALFENSLKTEAEALRQHPLAATGFNTGSKGLAYPL